METEAEINSGKKFKFTTAFFSLHKKEWALTLLFFVLSLIGQLYHEIWLDEAQHFLLARDSSSLSKLIYNCRLEGHPLLWNMLLLFITRFSQDVFYMQLLHILINCFTVYLIAGSNLNTFEKICIIFSYFIFYEYNIISRNYGLAVSLMIYSVIGYQRKTLPLIPLALALFLLVNTHLYALLFSIAFILCIEKYDAGFLRRHKRQLVFAGIIYLAGMAIALSSIIPPGHYRYLFMQYDDSGYFSSARILKTISVCLKGIFYLPDFPADGFHAVENSSYFFADGFSNLLLFCLSLLAIAIPVFLFRKNKFAVGLFILYLIIYSACNYFLPLISGIRYYGFFYVVFVICYLISKDNISPDGKILVRCIFLLQTINGIYFYTTDIREPFSLSEKTAGWLTNNEIDPAETLILNKTQRPGISAYTKQNYFGIETGTILSYCLWQNELNEELRDRKISEILQVHPQTIIISDGPLPAFIDSARIAFICRYNNSMLKNETVEIYRFNR